MQAKEFYKRILSVKIPLFMLLYGLWIFLYATLIKKADDFFLAQFIFVYTSIIIIAELLIAFLRVIRIVKQINKESRKKVKFNFLILPYFPAFVSTLFYSIIRVMKYGILYKREFLITLGITLFVNFFFSAIYNIKINAFEYIRESEE